MIRNARRKIHVQKVIQDCVRRPIEQLESRRLFCGLGHEIADVDFAPQYERPVTNGGPEVDTGGIVWANRGTTDNFAAAYGGQAENVRQVVDAAFFFWNKVIGSLNQTGGHSQLDVTLTATARGTGVGGGGGVSTLLGNKPRTGTITIGGGSDANGNGTVADAEGFYIDPTPYDYTEYQGNIINAFTGQATPGSAAANGNDMFTLVAAELQHTLGITSTGGAGIAWRTDVNDYLRLTTSDDVTDTPGDLWVFKSPSARVLLTSNNSGAGGVSRDVPVHSAKATNSVFYENETYTGVNDTGGASYNAGERNLPSYNAAIVLRDMYGYIVNPPQDVIGSFYAMPVPSARQVLVRNTDPTSSDLMQIRSGSGFFFIDIDIGNDVAGTNLNGLVVYQFNKLAFDTVIADGGGGTDYMRLESNAGSPVTLRGGAGDDFIDFSFGAKNLNNITANAHVEGGTGFDQVFVYDNNQAAVTAFTISSARFDRPGWGGFSYASDTEAQTLITGTAADTVNVTSTFTGQPVYLNSAGGADVVNIGNSSNGVRSINAPVEVNNSPSFSVVNINNGADTLARSVFAQTQGAFGIIGGLAPFLISYRYADVSAVNVTLGTGSDTVSILQAAKPLNFTASNGSQQNTFTLGNASEGTGGITANLRILAFGFAANNIVVDNFGGANRTASLAAGAGGEYVLSGFTGAGTVTYNRQAFNSGEAFTILGGFGNESLSINNVNAPGTVTFDGRGGFDTLLVDDRLQTAPVTRTDFTATSIVRIDAGALFPITYFTTSYSNLDSLTYYAKPSATTTNVTGVSSSIPAGQQVTIVLGNNADTVNLFPHDAAGNLTINGNIGIIGNGGSDILRVQDAASPNAINYAFSNPFGSGTQNLFGLGTGGLGTASIEIWDVLAGTGNDTFAMNQFTSGVGLGIAAGGGDDVLQFGNNGLALLTNLAFFNFVGGDGYDTFNLNNQSHAGTWTYTRNAGSITASSTSGASYFLTDANVELMRLNGGPSGETFNINAVAAGSAVEAYGAAGVDIIRMGSSSNNVEAIQGSVYYDAGANAGNSVIFDTFDTTGDTFHVDQTSVGAYLGDNLFGPGGSFTFTGMADTNVIAPALTIHLGSGSDVAYAQPLASGSTQINFNSQNFAARSGPEGAVGDSLNLALAAAVNYVITGTSTGNVVSDTTGKLTWSGVELPIAVDDAAPTADAADYLYDQATPALSVAFSEDVSSNLNTGSFIVTNIDTAEQLSDGVLALAFDTGTNTAALSFPGFPAGLPDGNYHLTVAPGYRDAFGNVSTAALDFDFFAFAGDANHDRTVNLDDFTALAAAFGTAGTFSQGDFDYSGNVNLDDFTILASKFGTTLPAPAGLPSARSTFSATAINADDERWASDRILAEIVI